MLRSILAAAALIGMTTLSFGKDLELSYVVSLDETNGIATVTARLADGPFADDYEVAECASVTPYEIGQNPLLTDLACDGDLIVAALTETGLQVTYRDEVTADIVLPDGNYWINSLPLATGR